MNSQSANQQTLNELCLFLMEMLLKKLFLIYSSCTDEFTVHVFCTFRPGMLSQLYIYCYLLINILYV